MKFDEVISGHGKWLAGKKFTVPEGTSVTIVAPPGAALSDKLGGYIESYAKTGHMLWPLPVMLKHKARKMAVYNDSGYPKTFKAGDEVPDFGIFPPDDLSIRETRGVQGSYSGSVPYALRSNDLLAHRPLLTAHDDKLSSIIRPHMGNVIVAVCSSNRYLPYAGYRAMLDPHAATIELQSLPACRGDDDEYEVDIDDKERDSDMSLGC